MATITLPDGRTLDMRLPVYLSEKNAIIELVEGIAGGQTLQWWNDLAAILRPAVTGTSWGGDVADMSEKWLAQVAREWQEATDEAVLPLPSARTSGTTRRRTTRRTLDSLASLPESPQPGPTPAM